jgi:hypothetical protein
VGVWVCGCVYKIEKFRTLSAPSEIAPPLRSNEALHKQRKLYCLINNI